MRLSDWLAANGLTQTAFARMVEARQGDVSRYCRPPGHPSFRIPRPPTMRRIFLATGGKVDANSFYDLPSLPAEPASAEAAA